jgi:glycosyltransferase involved in cell wall biosynthesis
MNKKRVLIVTPNSLHNGPRLIREIDVLKHDYIITAVGSTPPHDPDIRYIPYSSIQFSFFDRVIRKVSRTLLNRQIASRLPGMRRKIESLIKDVAPDLVIVHYPLHLPFFLMNKNRNYKVVYNAHEYHPLEFESDAHWMKTNGKLYSELYKQNLHKCDLVINVCDGIAAKCKEVFGVESLVIPNAASYYQGPYKDKFSPEKIRFIHHGGSNPDRKIEWMINAFEKLGEKYVLDLMLVNSDPDYFQKLEQKAAGISNVNFIKPVSFNEIIPLLTSYHAGVYNLPPVSFNNQYALPNKFFEYIQARLPIVSGPSVEMKSIIEKYKIGVVSEDFSVGSLVAAIQKFAEMNKSIFSVNAELAARELSAEFYQKQFITSVNTLF